MRHMPNRGAVDLPASDGANRPRVFLVVDGSEWAFDEKVAQLPRFPGASLSLVIR